MWHRTHIQSYYTNAIRVRVLWICNRPQHSYIYEIVRDFSPCLKEKCDKKLFSNSDKGETRSTYKYKQEMKQNQSKKKMQCAYVCLSAFFAEKLPDHEKSWINQKTSVLFQCRSNFYSSEKGDSTAVRKSIASEIGTRFAFTFRDM